MKTPTLEPSASRLDAQRALGDRVDRKEARCVVVGLGFIGSIVLEALHRAEFRVRGYDIDPRIVTAFQRKHGELGAFAGTSREVLKDADVIVIAVRALVHGDKIATSPLESVAADIRARVTRPALVIVESTVPVGTTRRVAHWLHATRESPMFVVHGPERLAGGQDWRDFKQTPHLVGGVDEPSGIMGERFLSRVCDSVTRVKNAETSELAKLLENNFRTVGIALVTETMAIAHAHGLSGIEVAEAAATKPFGYFPFYPRPGIGGHCLPNDLAILRSSAREARVHAPLLDAARRLAHLPTELTLGRLASLLEARGKRLDRARVLIVGVGFKVGSPDPTASPAIGIVTALRARGADVVFADEHCERFTVESEDVVKVDPRADALPYDAALLLSGMPSLSVDRLRELCDVVLDGGGSSAVAGDVTGLEKI